MKNVLFEKTEGGVGLVTLNRPKALNALCQDLFDDLMLVLNAMEKDPEVGCIVLTGSEKAFAAGADIKEMFGMEFPATYDQNMLAQWDSITKLQTPMIAAVNGFCLGGGCELAMLCDIMYCGEKAMFGQPEITIGTIPGMGGTQRLPKAIGKSRAMELALTGDFLGAEEACARGLASRVCKPDELVADAVKTATKIASMSKPTTKMVKESINMSFETTLATGLTFERRLFHSTFGTKDQKIGMGAFAKKQKPEWTDS